MNQNQEICAGELPKLDLLNDIVARLNSLTKSPDYLKKVLLTGSRVYIAKDLLDAANYIKMNIRD